MKQSTMILSVLAILSLVLANFNPLSVEGVSQILYFVPVLVAILYYGFQGSTPGRLSQEDKENVLKEKVKSIIRSVIQAIGVIVAFASAINFRIPYIGAVQDAIMYLSENIDIAWQAVGVVVGIAMKLAGFFMNKERFKARALSHSGVPQNK